MTEKELTESLKAQKLFGLSPSQWKIFSVLILREQLKIKQIYDILWADALIEPTQSKEAIQTHIVRIKKRVAKFNLTVNTVWGGGYFLSKSDRARALELAKQAMEK